MSQEEEACKEAEANYFYDTSHGQTGPCEIFRGGWDAAIEYAAGKRRVKKNRGRPKKLRSVPSQETA